MPETTNPHFELACLKGLADLESIEGPFLNSLTASAPKGEAFILRFTPS